MLQAHDDQLQAEFTSAVHKHHRELCHRGMNPNEACALALRVAAGQVSMPRPLSDLYDALRAAKESKDYKAVCRMIRTFFASPDALHASFWPSAHSPYIHSQQQQEAPVPASAATNNTAQHSSNGSSAHSGPAVPSSPGRPSNAVGNNGFNSSSTAHGLSSSSRQPQESWVQVDHAAVQELHDQLQACHEVVVRDALEQGCQQLLLHIATSSKKGSSSNPGFCRQVCGLFANPWLMEMDCHGLLAGIAGVLVDIQQQTSATGSMGPASGAAAAAAASNNCGHQLQQLFRSWGEKEMRRAVALLQQYITITLYTQQTLTAGIQAASKLLGMLQDANEVSKHLGMADFYNDAVNEPDFNIKEDYKRWKSSQRLFSFCSCPWIFDPASKSRILQLENQMQQLEAFERSVMGAFFGGSGCPFLVLRVRRGPFLLSDTLLQINGAKIDNSLKKPLKVKFVGEEGVDEGGPQKEFFQLLVRQCFNPEFGMFAYSDETRLHWFHASSMDLDTEYELIGILIGLAIYNSHILEFQFPMVLFKKLLSQPVGMEDLAELEPDIHRSLLKLQQMRPEELSGMGLTFQIESEVGFGERCTVDLLPGGASIPVTVDNVGQYCQLYVQHLLVGSIERQFKAFHRGFLRLCSGEALKLFRPAELEQLVCGGRVVDLTALEAATHYDDGYHQHSTPVRWFWEVVHALDDAQQKRLLFFITGSDRVPIKGLGHLSPPFVISRNGSEDSRLPTAHTCFNHLLLPAYKDKETMRQRLMLALENAEGFGLL